MSLSDDLSRHQVFLQRLVGTEKDSIKSYLDQLRTAGHLAVATGQYGQALKDSLRNATKDLKDTAIDNMTDFAEYESKFSAKAISKYTEETLDPVDADILRKALITTNMEINNIDKRLGNRKSLDNAYKQFAMRKADEVAQIVRDGQIQGTAGSEVITSINALIDGRQSAQAYVLAKTSVNYTTTLARMETLQANSDIIDKVIWTLGDAYEHTDYCLDQEGEIYNVDDGPRPPAHYGCVSYMEPYFEDSPSSIGSR